MKQNQQEKGTGDIKHRTLKDISALSLLLLLSFIISRVVPTYLPLFAFKSCTNLPTYHCSHSTVAQIYPPTIVRIQQLHRSTYLPLFAFNSCTDLPTYHCLHSTVAQIYLPTIVRIQQTSYDLGPGETATGWILTSRELNCLI